MAKHTSSRKKRRAIIFVIEVIIIIVLLGVLYVYSKLDKIETEDIKEEEIQINEIKSETIGGYKNIALFGLDSRETGSLDEGNRSDTIMVASINNATNEVKLVSVYRDTYLDQSDGSFNKANNAYQTGGPRQAIDMLNINLDLDITDYVSVDFLAVSDVIDLLGGIEIDVTEEEIQWINGYATETQLVTGKTTVDITSPGLQTLDGVQAVSYSRIRYTAGDDYKRTERQRTVLTKMMEKAKSADILTLNKIVDAVLPEVKTSLSSTEILSMASKVASYKIGEQSGFPFDKLATNVGTLDCVVPATLESNVKDLHKFLFGEENYDPSDKVKSLNEEIIYNSGVTEPGY